MGLRNVKLRRTVARTCVDENNPLVKRKDERSKSGRVLHLRAGAGGGESAPGRRASLRAAGRCAASAAGWRSGPCAEVGCWRHLRPALRGHAWARVLGSPAPALSLACISGPRKGLLIRSQTVTLMKRSSLICEIPHTILERGDDFLHEFAVIRSLLCLARYTS